MCELERERELEAVFLDRVAEELLGACDAVQDRVAVGVEAVCGARSAAAVMQVGAEGLAQAGGPCVLGGEGAEGGGDERGRVLTVVCGERDDLDAARDERRPALRPRARVATSPATA